MRVRCFTSSGERQRRRPFRRHRHPTFLTVRLPTKPLGSEAAPTPSHRSPLGNVAAKPQLSKRDTRRICTSAACLSKEILRVAATRLSAFNARLCGAEEMAEVRTTCSRQQILQRSPHTKRGRDPGSDYVCASSSVPATQRKPSGLRKVHEHCYSLACPGQGWRFGRWMRRMTKRLPAVRSRVWLTCL
jgi:hypothetical protein